MGTELLNKPHCVMEGKQQQARPSAELVHTHMLLPASGAAFQFNKEKFSSITISHYLITPTPGSVSPFPPRSWAPTGITKLHETPNCATQALVIWSDTSLHPCHIHPDIPVISILTSLSYPSYILAQTWWVLVQQLGRCWNVVWSQKVELVVTVFIRWL